MNLPARWDAGWYLGIVLGRVPVRAGQDRPAAERRVLSRVSADRRGVGRLLGGAARRATCWAARSCRSPRSWRARLSVRAGPRPCSMTTRPSRRCGWSPRIRSRCSTARSTPSRCTCSGSLRPSTHFTRRGTGPAAVGPARRTDAAERLLSLGAAGVLALVAAGCRRGSPADRRRSSRSDDGDARRWPSRRRRSACWSMPAYVWRLTGDPLAWVAGHVAWGRTYQGLARSSPTGTADCAMPGSTGYVASCPATC